MDQDNSTPLTPLTPDSQQKPALTVQDKFALTEYNPVVQDLAKRLHWKPSTAITRIQKALPTKLEQDIYLSIAGHFGIQPETLAKLLALWRDHNPLTEISLEKRNLGRQLQSNPLARFTEYLEACMDMMKVLSKDYPEATFSVEVIGKIVLHEDDPERLIEMVDEELDECCEILDLSDGGTHGSRLRICVWVIVTQVLPWGRQRGLPEILELADLCRHFGANRVDHCFLDEEMRDHSERVGSEEVAILMGQRSGPTEEEVISGLARSFYSKGPHDGRRRRR